MKRSNVKINENKLRRIISEEINAYICEASVEGLTDDAKNKVEQSIQSAISSGDSLVNSLIAAVQSAGETHEISTELQDQIVSLQSIIDSVKSTIEESINEKSEDEIVKEIIRKIGSNKFRIYSKSKNKKTGKRRNLGTFKSKDAAKEHEKDIRFFKHSN